MKLIVKTLKIIGVIISAFIITVIAQNLGILWHLFHWYRIESILHAITYIIATYILIKLFITKVLNDKLSHYNIKPFRFYPSILFASFHLFNGMLNGMSLLLLIISGTLAGVLYSLATITFNNIWASIYLHMMWNLFGLINISPHNEGIGVLQYTIKTNNIALTGGEYGMDTSIISVCFYIIGIAVLGVMYYKKKVGNS